MPTRTLTIILAGGKGSRLEPLTAERAKPAVPFAGGYRIIDFPMSNCVNSGLFQVLVLPQYKSLSLDRHLDLAWKPLFLRELGAFLDVVPPQQRVDEEWYRGTADAVYQNIYSIEQAQPDDVLILAGDHIYAMDYREMLDFHRTHDADVTVGAYRVPLEEAARQFGVIQTDKSHRVIGFQEKPARPTPLPGDPRHTLASMGIYVFKTKFLLETLCAMATEPEHGHDFGHHVLPELLQGPRVMAYPFRAPRGSPNPYWKDVGTIDAYYEAHQDLLQSDSPLKLDWEHWPIRTYKPNLSPPMFLTARQEACYGSVRDSLVCAGCRLVGASLAKSVLGYRCQVSSGSRLENSILLGDVTIGRNVQMRKVIVDKFVQVPDEMRIGFDRRDDLSRGFTISPGGVTVVPRGFICRPERSETDQFEATSDQENDSHDEVSELSVFSGNGRQ